jgi:hypothetical protein
VGHHARHGPPPQRLAVICTPPTSSRAIP